MLHGIPALDIRYEFDKQKYPGFGNYPAYHTIYDNERYVKKFLDPDMRYHKSVTEMLLMQLLRFSDDVVLPFDLTRYAVKIKTDWEQWKLEFEEILANQSVSIDILNVSIGRMVNVTENFHKNSKKKLNKQDINQVRKYNDQLMWFERAFIVPEGILKSPGLRHSIFSSGTKSLFSRNTFPALSMTLYKILIEKTNTWDDLPKEISILVNNLNNAMMVLQGDTMESS